MDRMGDAEVAIDVDAIKGKKLMSFTLASCRLLWRPDRMLRTK